MLCMQTCEASRGLSETTSSRLPWTIDIFHSAATSLKEKWFQRGIKCCCRPNSCWIFNTRKTTWVFSSCRFFCAEAGESSSSSRLRCSSALPTQHEQYVGVCWLTTSRGSWEWGEQRRKSGDISSITPHMMRASVSHVTVKVNREFS